MSTEETVRAVIAAYDRGDAQAVGALLAPDLRYCVHSDPETGPYTADCHCLEEFWQAVGRIQKDWSIDSYRLVNLIVQGDRAASRVAASVTSRHTGRTHRIENAFFWTVRDGRVTELHEFHDTMTAASARG